MQLCVRLLVCLASSGLCLRGGLVSLTVTRKTSFRVEVYVA